MKRRRHLRSRTLLGGRSLRIMPIFVAALAVIAGMLVMTDYARREADRAREAQAVMERTRTLGAGIDSLTWRRLASGRKGGTDATVSEGLRQYEQLTASLRHLQELGVPRARTAPVEQRLGAAYGQGMQALLASRDDGAAGARIARTGFAPAMRRFDDAIAALAKEQDRIAQAAQQRTWLGWLGSLTIGLLLLCLLGWRLHRIQRRSAVAEQARDAERRGDERLHALVRHSSDVVAVIDGEAHIRWIADSVRSALGYRPADALGIRLPDHVHPDDAVATTRFLEQTAQTLGRAGSLSLRLRAADGTYRAVEMIAHNHIGDPLIDGILLNVRDVSDRVALEEQLRYQAFHDDLTGLANRALFEDRLTQALSRSRRHDGQLGVIFVDLDDFKTVNDTLGHAVGDELLRATARRLATCLRVQDTAARLGGDEFAILLEDLSSPDEAWEIAERLRHAFESPVHLDGREITASASLGVHCPGHDVTADAVLGNADIAMYAAKDAGKGRVARFEPAMRAQLLERVELGTALGSALERDELFLEYQPLVELDTERIIGVEALIRWQHPTRGRLAPDLFIPLAETNGTIVEIGRWVLETACMQLRRWQVETGSPELQMSVNVSTRQLADPNLARHVRAAIDAAGIDPSLLTLEITEHLLLDDGELTQRRLQTLKEIGVRLAIDDFGTGYSALSYLQTFPLDVLKIDRSFVSGIDHDDERARLVRSIVEMGHNLSLSVVSEGIEEAGEAALMREFRSQYGQGYLFSKPVDVATLDHLLADNKTLMESA